MTYLLPTAILRFSCPKPGDSPTQHVHSSTPKVFNSHQASPERCCCKVTRSLNLTKVHKGNRDLFRPNKRHGLDHHGHRNLVKSQVTHEQQLTIDEGQEHGGRGCLHRKHATHTHTDRTAYAQQLTEVWPITMRSEKKNVSHRQKLANIARRTRWYVALAGKCGTSAHLTRPHSVRRHRKLCHRRPHEPRRAVSLQQLA